MRTLAKILVLSMQIEVWKLFKSHLRPDGMIVANIGKPDRKMNNRIIECIMRTFDGRPST